MPGSRESERRKCTTRLCNCSSSSQNRPCVQVGIEFIDDKLFQRMPDKWSRPSTWHSSFQTWFDRNTANTKYWAHNSSQRWCDARMWSLACYRKIDSWNKLCLPGICEFGWPGYAAYSNRIIRNEINICEMKPHLNIRWLDKYESNEYLTCSRSSGNRSRGELIWITNACTSCTRSRISFFCSGCASSHKNGTAPNRTMCMLEGKPRIEHVLFSGLEYLLCRWPRLCY